MGNGLETVLIAVVCIALLVRVTLTDANVIILYIVKTISIIYLIGYRTYLKRVGLIESISTL